MLSLLVRCWSRCVGVALVVGLVAGGLVLSGLGDRFLSCCVAQFGRAARTVSGAASDLEVRFEGARLQRSNRSFVELVRCRETLRQQVQGLASQQEVISARLRRDGELLQAIHDVLEGRATPVVDGLSRSTVERDASSVLLAIQSDQAELAKVDSLLRSLSADLQRLDHEVGKARRALLHQGEGLERRKAVIAGERATQDAHDLGRTFDELSR